MSCTITTAAKKISIDATVRLRRSQVDDALSIFVYVNGVQVGPAIVDTTGSANREVTLACAGLIVPVPAGTHKVDVYWTTGSGTMTAIGTDRRLTVKELD